MFCYKRIVITGTIRSIIEDMLAQLRFEACETSVALNIKEMIKLTKKVQPDFVLIELEMGGISIKDGIAKLRKIPTFKDKPVFVYQCPHIEGPHNRSIIQQLLSSDARKSNASSKKNFQYIGVINEKTFINSLVKALKKA